MQAACPNQQQANAHRCPGAVHLPGARVHCCLRRPRRRGAPIVRRRHGGIARQIGAGAIGCCAAVVAFSVVRIGAQLRISIQHIALRIHHCRLCRIAAAAAAVAAATRGARLPSGCGRQRGRGILHRPAALLAAGAAATDGVSQVACCVCCCCSVLRPCCARLLRQPARLLSHQIVQAGLHFLRKEGGGATAVSRQCAPACRNQCRMHGLPSFAPKRCSGAHIQLLAVALELIQDGVGALQRLPAWHRDVGTPRRGGIVGH